MVPNSLCATVRCRAAPSAAPFAFGSPLVTMGTMGTTGTIGEPGSLGLAGAGVTPAWSRVLKHEQRTVRSGATQARRCRQGTKDLLCSLKEQTKKQVNENNIFLWNILRKILVVFGINCQKCRKFSRKFIRDDSLHSLNSLRTNFLVLRTKFNCHTTTVKFC